MLMNFPQTNRVFRASPSVMFTALKPCKCPMIYDKADECAATMLWGVWNSQSQIVAHDTMWKHRALWRGNNHLLVFVLRLLSRHYTRDVNSRHPNDVLWWDKGNHHESWVSRHESMSNFEWTRRGECGGNLSSTQRTKANNWKQLRAAR
jgi:hypothetical protein